MTTGDPHQIPHAPADEPGGRRLALVIATSTYSDHTLAKLRAPGEDAKRLAAVLEDERIGQFDVDTVSDAPADTIRRRIAQFCAQGGPNDLALVYLSCHGVLDARGRLYYATADTERELLSVTAVPAAWLIEHLDDCKCRQQILVLDCCHSGAFAKGAKGSSDLALRKRVEGRGRVVLTASRATEYSFEGDHVVGEAASSVFTGALVKGLTSGDADSDSNGLITVNELFDYAYHAVKATDAQQNPSIWSYGAEGSLLVARSPRGVVIKPAPLPEHLTAALENPGPRVRAGAVAELGDLLAGTDVGRALTARERLEHVALHDVPLVANAAREILDAHPDRAPRPTAPLGSRSSSSQSPRPAGRPEASEPPTLPAAPAPADRPATAQPVAAAPAALDTRALPATRPITVALGMSALGAGLLLVSSLMDWLPARNLFAAPDFIGGVRPPVAVAVVLASGATVILIAALRLRDRSARMTWVIALLGGLSWGVACTAVDWNIVGVQQGDSLGFLGKRYDTVGLYLALPATLLVLVGGTWATVARRDGSAKSPTVSRWDVVAAVAAALFALLMVTHPSDTTGFGGIYVAGDILLPAVALVAAANLVLAMTGLVAPGERLPSTLVMSLGASGTAYMFTAFDLSAGDLPAAILLAVVAASGALSLSARGHA